MSIINKTKNRPIAQNHNVCDTLGSKAKGLMFTRRMTYSLIFPFRKEQFIHVHMFFVFYPIDILWLDKNKEIVELREQVRPFRFVWANTKSQYLVELPSNTLSKTNTEVGDIVDF